MSEIVNSQPGETSDTYSKVISNQSFTEAFIALVNNHRTNMGLRSLILDEALSQNVLNMPKVVRGLIFGLKFLLSFN